MFIRIEKNVNNDVEAENESVTFNFKRIVSCCFLMQQMYRICSLPFS
jgi:hypothetical protein